jgi:hypothetical protein
MLEERHILHCLQEKDLEVWEVILVEELEHDLHPTDGRDLSAELDKTVGTLKTGHPRIQALSQDKEQGVHPCATT